MGTEGVGETGYIDASWLERGLSIHPLLHQLLSTCYFSLICLIGWSNPDIAISIPRTNTLIKHIVYLSC